MDVSRIFSDRAPKNKVSLVTCASYRVLVPCNRRLQDELARYSIKVAAILASLIEELREPLQ